VSERGWRRRRRRRREGGGSWELAVRKKNKNPTQRMWGIIYIYIYMFENKNSKGNLRIDKKQGNIGIDVLGLERKEYIGIDTLLRTSIPIFPGFSVLAINPYTSCIYIYIYIYFFLWGGGWWWGWGLGLGWGGGLPHPSLLSALWQLLWSWRFIGSVRTP
jgi:hypothetical protein